MHLFCKDINEAFHDVLCHFLNDFTMTCSTTGSKEKLDWVEQQLQDAPSFESTKAIMEEHSTNLIRYYSNEETRNGPVIRYNFPLVVTYFDPLSRVLQNPARRCNPFFHLYEAMWMLSGCNDVESLANIVPTIKDYSDDGVTFHGAYGHRWRKHFLGDQLAAVINMLRKEPTTRRCVLQMWAPYSDLEGFEFGPRADSIKLATDLKALEAKAKHLGKQIVLPGPVPTVVPKFTTKYSKDYPCNLSVKFLLTNGKLDMTVDNRSNDIIWGMLGANYVHFSFLHEFVATMSGQDVGCYHHITNNAHIYIDKFPKEKIQRYHDAQQNLQLPEVPYRCPLITNEDTFDQECLNFVKDPLNGNARPKNRFFREIAYPMLAAWHCAKLRQWDKAAKHTEQITQEDWKLNASVWIEQTKIKYLKSQS